MAYPPELENQLKAGDRVLKFVALKTGWIALTEQRVLYRGRVYYSDTNTTASETGNLPLDKISSMAVKQLNIGCLGKKAVVAINMHGAIYNIILGKDASAAQPLIIEFNSRN